MSVAGCRCLTAQYLRGFSEGINVLFTGMVLDQRVQCPGYSA
jgi:hypothetical protein